MVARRVYASTYANIAEQFKIYLNSNSKERMHLGYQKTQKKLKKDELITMLETVDRAIKRSASESKLSQLKRIKKQLVKKYEDLGEEFIEYE